MKERFELRPGKPGLFFIYNNHLTTFVFNTLRLLILRNMNEILSAIVVLLSVAFGAWLSYFFQKKSSKIKTQQVLQFKIFMNLLDIKASYFWIESAEINQDKPDNAIFRRIHDLTWRTCDLLRKADDIKYLEDILDVLLNENFKSANARGKAFDEVINKYQSIINPRYSRKVKKISDQNWAFYMENGFPIYGAPGSSHTH